MISATVALALLCGLPWLLVAAVGNPLRHWPDLVAGDISNQVILAALACLAWILWAQFAVAFLVELASAIRRTPMPARIPAVLASQQWLARALVNGVLLLLPVTVSSVAPAGQALAMTAALPSTPASSIAPADRGGPTTPSSAVATVVVAADGARTWWDLAERHLGDGAAWRDLWTLNAGRTQPDGTTLTSERIMLRPGWTVLVPADPGAPLPPPPGDETETAPTQVVVRPGDTLTRIAAEHDSGDWTELWQANEGRSQPGGEVFTDPDLIEPGWVITIPTSGTADGVTRPTVTVRSGDTLSRIAADHGITVDKLLAANIGVAQPDGDALTDPDLIHVGWELALPDPADVPPPAQTEPAGPTGGGEGPSADTHEPPTDTSPPTSGAPSASAPAPADIPPAPPTSDPSTEQPAATPAAEPERGEVDGDSATTTPPAVPIAAFAGAGGVLAALALATLIGYRRRQFRHRRPGHAPSATPDDLVAMERALLAAGSAAAPDAEFLHHALHGIAHLSAAGDSPPPDVAAAVLTDRDLTLLLHTPRADAAGAWVGSNDGHRWTLQRTDPTGYQPARRGWLAPPYPTLVTVGSTPAGEHWLIDLERAGALTVSGDRKTALGLARSMVAELAHNSWSESVEVTMTGFGRELAAMHPERLTHLDSAATAFARLRRHRDATADAMQATGTDVLTGRNSGVAGDAWNSQVLLVAAPDAATGAESVDLGREPARSTVAVVTVGEATGTASRPRWELRVTEDGLLSIPALGATLIAQQIPEAEADRLARLLSFAADPTPVGDPHEDGRVHLRGNSGPKEIARPGSLLAEPDSTYLATTATTTRDLQCLAPAVSSQHRKRAEAADTSLDADFAAWHDPDTPRPRIALFGGPTVRVGNARFSAFNVEIAAYLATRTAGVGIDRYASDLWPTEPDIVSQTTVRSKVRTSLSQFRKLLGTDPVTGEDYLPRNTGKAAAEYRLSPAVLVDVDLFDRLRVRGQVRGPNGLTDLHAALELVTGPPLAARRPGGYGWLADTPIDHHLSAAVVDLAHLVATHHLAHGEPEEAAAAAQTALRAGSSEDTPLLDLVAVCHAQGQVAQADVYIRRIMANHGADVEEDLPPRTYEVLLRRQWLPPAA
ncbi:LysM peptidoglycan-binding domain-containing protein [Nakamurella multipartita]|uniref:LysM peptidoglycan-binding domain-containing protein n=1 Tax=Nakamurella multipartita TaxID=53461 RepID=UPI0002EF7B32|nr:LysM peptidoglycan-binding domain-containing protein [Nakamurella multipartita]